MEKLGLRLYYFLDPALPVTGEERNFGDEIIPLGNFYPNGIR